jgi:phosphomannomutase
MTLISSISGIRGTIGGSVGSNLTPVDIVHFAAAYGTWVTLKTNSRTVVIGRDARPSGEMVSQIVSGTLVGLGLKVVDLGLSTTPTVEMAVPALKAAGELFSLLLITPSIGTRSNCLIIAVSLSPKRTGWRFWKS